MTTIFTGMESATVADNPLRIPLIAADLLPAEVVDARRGKKVRRAVLAALIVIAALIAGWYVASRHKTSDAKLGLTAAQEAGQRIENQKKSYAEVITVQQQSTVIDKQLATLMALDLRWSNVVVAIQQATPAGIKLQGMTAATNRNGSSGADQAAGASGEHPIGTLTLTGRGPSKAAVAGFVDALDHITGVLDPLLTSAVQQKDGVAFTVGMDLTEVVLGGHYSFTSAGGN